MNAARLESLCYFLGIWRGNDLEGSHGPGNVFRHVTGQRQHGYTQSQISILISALRAPTKLQGFLTTRLIGLAGYIYAVLRPRKASESFGPVIDEMASNDGAKDAGNGIGSEVASDTSHCLAFSHEGLIQWLYDRCELWCERRLEKTVLAHNPSTPRHFNIKPAKSFCLSCWLP